MLMIQTLPRSDFRCGHVLVQKRLLKDPSRPNKFMIQSLARSSSEKTQVDQKKLMIHTLPRYFLFALLGTFSHVL